MLVLTRKPDQSIIIGDGIEIEVLSVSGEKVRLGITAPPEVDIFRHEIYERIQDERAVGEKAKDNGTGSRRVERALGELSGR